MIKSLVIKRSIVLAGRKTSISLEDDFWKGLKDIARRDERTLAAIMEEIDDERDGNLSSAVRVFVLRDAMARVAAGESV
jgi:predicted DNA-binding ribbon-helix-helix protein